LLPAVATEPIEFETQRLSFRVWQGRHIPAFVAMNADAEVMRYFPSVQSSEQSIASVETWLRQFAEQGWSNWAVERRPSGEFLGFIGLSVPKRRLPFSPCVEIGWRLRRSAWGQGYATEGAKACLRIGFERIGLKAIVSFTALQNLPSVAVMQRIGMSNANANFDHPGLPPGHALRPHCLYKISRSVWMRHEV